MIESRKLVLLVRWLSWMYLCFLTVMSLIPMPQIIELNFNDLVLHGGAYAGLMWLFSQAYAERRHWFWMAGFVLWGAMLELTQGILPYRMFEYADLVANTLGVIFGWVVSAWHRPVFKMGNGKNYQITS